MMKKPLLLLTLFATLIWAGCTKIKGPEFRKIDSFRIKNVDLQQATIGFNVAYYNPNNFGVTAKEAHIDVFVDSLFLGTFTSDSAVVVHRSSDFSIPFTGVIPLQKALKLNVPQLATKDVLIRADGSVRLGKAGIFITEPIHYSGMHSLYEISRLYGMP